jgi:hypothetical protein
MRFASANGLLWASIADPHCVDLRSVDLCAMHVDGDAALRLVNDCAGMLHNLASGAPLQPVLFWLQEAEHVLQLLLPEIAADAASMPILARLLGDLYSQDGPEELVAPASILPLLREPPAISTTDYNYWLNQLRALPRWTLPEEGFNRAAVIEPCPLPESDNEIPDAVFVAAFAAMLGRYSGETDVVVAVHGLGRRPERANVAGPLTPIALLRIDLASDPTLAEILATVEKQLVEALERCSLNLPSAVARLTADRQLGYVPPFRYEICFEGESSGVAPFGELNASWHTLRSRASLVGPGICVNIGRKPLQGHIRYAARCQVPDFAKSYRSTLQSLLYDSGTHASAAPTTPANGIPEILQLQSRETRLDLHEIEVCLRHHSRIKEVVAVAQRDESGKLAKIAYVTASPRLESDGEDMFLRWMAGRLPAGSLPSAVVILDDMPRTDVSDLDWRALPVSGGCAVRVDMPRNDLERVIANIWQELLGPKQIGVTRQFFESGGDSLLLVQLHELLQRRLNRKFSALDLFTHSTIQAQAAYFANHSPVVPQT